LRGSAGVHEDGSAAEVGAGGGHGGVPGVAGDVVDDFGSGFDGEAGGGGVEGVDGEDGVEAFAAAFFEDGGEDGEDAGLLFFGGDWGGVGAGGFTAEVEDVGAFVEDAEGASDGFVGGFELAAVGEAVGGEIEDGHDKSAGAESEGAGAETPVEGGTDWLGRVGAHDWILEGVVAGCWFPVAG